MKKIFTFFPLLMPLILNLVNATDSYAQRKEHLEPSGSSGEKYYCSFFEGIQDLQNFKIEDIFLYILDNSSCCWYDVGISPSPDSCWIDFSIFREITSYYNENHDTVINYLAHPHIDSILVPPSFTDVDAFFKLIDESDDFTTNNIRFLVTNLTGFWIYEIDKYTNHNLNERDKILRKIMLADAEFKLNQEKTLENGEVFDFPKYYSILAKKWREQDLKLYYFDTNENLLYGILYDERKNDYKIKVIEISEKNQNLFK